MANANRNARELVKARLRAAPGNYLPWSEVMNLALYEPGCGYYRNGVRSIGRSGDFYTSVSVGHLYGALLAECCVQVWRALGEPENFALLEQGANDGALAEDILQALQTSHPDFAAKVRCIIIEPDEEHRRVQSERLGAKVQHVESWDEHGKAPLHGVLICNELLDAFPMHRVCYKNGHWQEMVVSLDRAGELCWSASEIANPALVRELALLAGRHAEGCILEINLASLDWMRAVSRSAFRGAVLLADYGYATDPDSPGDAHDTLRRYHQHRTDGNVLEDLGEADLTSHVNFTRVAEVAMDQGLQVAEFVEQGRYLTRLAAEIMTRPGFVPNAQWMRQFQTLTHPGHLGHSFQMLLLAKGIPATALNSSGNIEAAQRRLGLLIPPSA